MRYVSSWIGRWTVLRAPWAPFAAVTLPVGLALGLAGCDTSDSAVEPTVYEARGQVAALPRAEEPQSGLRISHESVPGFRDIEGHVVGMDAMTMEFPPAPELDISSLRVGDKIAFTFEASPRWVMTEYTLLPEETELDFTSEPPEADEVHEHGHEGGHGHEHGHESHGH